MAWLPGCLAAAGWTRAEEPLQRRQRMQRRQQPAGMRQGYRCLTHYHACCTPYCGHRAVLSASWLHVLDISRAV